jgi:hypothetical protein
MGDILDLDIERRWIKKVEPSPAQHALPGPGWLRMCRHGENSGRRGCGVGFESGYRGQKKSAVTPERA